MNPQDSTNVDNDIQDNIDNDIQDIIDDNINNNIVHENHTEYIQYFQYVQTFQNDIQQIYKQFFKNRLSYQLQNYLQKQKIHK